MTDLGIDLGWGAWPGSSAIPPFWKIGQRESNFVRRPRLAGICRNHSGGSCNRGVVWIGNEVTASHSILFFRFFVSEKEGSAEECRTYARVEEGERERGEDG